MGKINWQQMNGHHLDRIQLIPTIDDNGWVTWHWVPDLKDIPDSVLMVLLLTMAQRLAGLHGMENILEEINATLMSRGRNQGAESIIRSSKDYKKDDSPPEKQMDQPDPGLPPGIHPGGIDPSRPPNNSDDDGYDFEEFTGGGFTERN